MFLVACTTSNSSTIDPVLNGDSCAVHTDQQTCAGEPDCNWYALGRPCPDDGSYCQSGVCQGPSGGSGSGSSSGGGGGSASGHAVCACLNGGVCFEQVGGPAQQGGTTPQIQCTIPAAGNGDVCTRVVGQGHCSDSANVGGLCICDNGIR